MHETAPNAVVIARPVVAGLLLGGLDRHRQHELVGAAGTARLDLKAQMPLSKCSGMKALSASTSLPASCSSSERLASSSVEIAVADQLVEPSFL
jgi:hypothetical protein